MKISMCLPIILVSLMGIYSRIVRSVRRKTKLRSRKHRSGELMQDYKSISKQAIGAGGTAIVYLYKIKDDQTDLKKPKYVAVKEFIWENRDSALLEISENFHIYTAFVSHPEIITEAEWKRYGLILEYYEEKDKVQVTMPYYPIMLDHVCSYAGLTLENIVSLIHGFADVLNKLHQVKFAHNDLKPQNVGLDIQGNPTLIDFGLSCHSTDQLNGCKNQTTYVYSCPELFETEKKTIDNKETEVIKLDHLIFEDTPYVEPIIADHGTACDVWEYGMTLLRVIHQSKGISHTQQQYPKSTNIKDEDRITQNSKKYYKKFFEDEKKKELGKLEKKNNQQTNKITEIYTDFIKQATTLLKYSEYSLDFNFQENILKTALNSLPSNEQDAQKKNMIESIITIFKQIFTKNIKERIELTQIIKKTEGLPKTAISVEKVLQKSGLKEKITDGEYTKLLGELKNHKQSSEFTKEYFDEKEKELKTKTLAQIKALKTNKRKHTSIALEENK